MDRSIVKAAYAQSLLWIALFVALAFGISTIVELILVDFVHGNPNRTYSNAAFMMFAYPPLIGVLSTIVVFIVFTLPQCIQALATYILIPRFGRVAYVVVLFLVPAVAVITRYCYDYLTPSDMELAINAGPDWEPYKHGITLQRYLSALARQAPVTAFTLAYCDATTRRASKRSIILAACVLAIVAGGIWGHGLAEQQFQFIDRRSAG
jgi:hypothetical protein